MRPMVASVLTLIVCLIGHVAVGRFGNLWVDFETILCSIALLLLQKKFRCFEAYFMECTHDSA
jgi:hypothetical protein